MLLHFWVLLAFSSILFFCTKTTFAEISIEPLAHDVDVKRLGMNPSKPAKTKLTPQIRDRAFSIANLSPSSNAEISKMDELAKDLFSYRVRTRSWRELDKTYPWLNEAQFDRLKTALNSVLENQDAGNSDGDAAQ